MTDPLPPYPPREDAWRFPPPPVSPRWLWVAIGAVVTTAVTLIALVVTLVTISLRDLPASVDDFELVDAISEGCDALYDGVESVEVNSIGIDRIDRLEHQNSVLQQVLADWLALDSDLRASDEPFDEWLGDWQLLLDARTAYIEELRGNPSATFAEPKDGDTVIAERMDRVSTGCLVPDSLLHPDKGIVAPA
ncbi:MAG: hypothetical protein QM597_03385 [Aeromicrobium sp.]|uniref:hypothetical protein n=1 Tax=Aeromicrobium sp. TaxID=1871063 RepID=UPI0039E2FC48